MPELVARGFVGGGRSLVGKARALPIATKVSFTVAGATTASYWPSRERWATVPEQAAFREAAASLQTTLGRRIDAFASPKLGLTGGLDSTVVALSLARAGRAFDTFTWGEPDWPDALQAQATARALGVRHELLSPEYRRGSALLRAIDEEVRWNEGAAPISFHARRWPRGLDAVIFGTGGETGRAFYYDHDLVRTFPRPSGRQLRRFFDARKAIFYAHRAAKEELRAQEGRWLQEAAAAGVAGWRCLDVIYNDQRVCNWARSMVPRLRAVTVGAFATPTVARALISLPAQERLRDGFHLRFLAGTEGLARDSPPPPPEPGALRRVLASAPGARLAGHNMRRLRGPSPGAPWYARDLWGEQTEFRDWLCQEVLESPLVIAGLGPRWANEARRGLLAGESRSTEGVLQAAGPVALSKAVSGLPDLSRVPT